MHTDVDNKKILAIVKFGRWFSVIGVCSDCWSVHPCLHVTMTLNSPLLLRILLGSRSLVHTTPQGYTFH